MNWDFVPQMIYSNEARRRKLLPTSVMQKTKWHILSTAPLPETLVQETVAQNIILDVIPFIETKPVIDDKIATQIQQLFQKSITAVFTSSNAVTAVAKHFQKHISWRIYTVGNA